MPNPVPTEDSLAFGRRLVALMEHARHDRQGAGAYLAKRYKVSTVTANAWLNGEHKCSSGRARRIAQDHGCTFESLYFGPKLVFPTEESKAEISQPAPRQIFTKERRASGDVVALQLGLQALVKTVLSRLPGTAEPFLYLLNSAANELSFSADAGLLASLVGIADEALSAEEEVNRALQRARSGGRPKPKK